MPESSTAYLADNLIRLLDKIGLSLTQAQPLYQLLACSVLLVIALISFYLSRYVMHKQVLRFVEKSRTLWDDRLVEHGFFNRSAHLIPSLALYLLTPALFEASQGLYIFLTKFSLIYLLASALLAAISFLNSAEAIYNESALAKRAPITGFIQVAKLALTIIFILLSIAGLLDKSPLILMSGLGAITAILLLIFRDAILGFVAGIQIAANRMVNNGDWIEMPKYHADGDVLAVGLTTVKVQNWDKSISTIPTHALISEPVKNWRGMQESDGRRIKRSLYIDIQSVKFCDHGLLEHVENLHILKPYIDRKNNELLDDRKQRALSDDDIINARKLTNLGTFRAYMQSYIDTHPQINHDMTCMIRQLPPSELGLPLEVYCFSSEKDWVRYEAIQADIFDHFLAMLPLFELRAYQRISDK
ncbi:mechanosensitive ion channel [Alteromonadaceae bacterium M269]|nr:mechanosensitive ion channel [Alteromonadaceae bacterium M269]